MKRYLIVIHVFFGSTLFGLPEVAPQDTNAPVSSMPRPEDGVVKKNIKKKQPRKDIDTTTVQKNPAPQDQLRMVKRDASGVLREDFKEDKALQRKMNIAEKMVTEAAEFFAEVGLPRACRSFEKDDHWYHGEIDIDVFDAEGNCYLFGSELLGLFANFKNVEKTRELRGITALGTGFIEDMVAKGDQGGGWVSFDWNYATNYSYARTVERDGVKYIICAGMYPESPRFQMRQLTKEAIRYALAKGADDAFRQINNPAGDFVRGDGYLFAFDMEGNNWANSRNPAIVGQNQLDWKDSAGRYRNKIMIDLVAKQGSGWIEYEDAGLIKYAYVEGFTDPRTEKRYIIGGGYYPFINNDMVIAYVKRAAEYLKARGRTVALRDFASYAGGFTKGPLRILVLNMEGVALADGMHPLFIGQNLMNMRDSQGKYYIRDMIDMVKKQGRGWISYIENKAYRSTYAEYVETPDGKFIIASGYWPASKEYSVQTLAEKAALYLKTHDNVEAFHNFIGESEDFLHGDLSVEVYTLDGICIVYGLDLERVWNDEMTILDNKGYPIINRVINMAKQGGGWTEYPMRKAKRHVYTQLVTKPIERKGVEKIAVEEQVTTVNKNGVIRNEILETSSKREQSFVVAVGYYE